MSGSQRHASLHEVLQSAGMNLTEVAKATATLWKDWREHYAVGGIPINELCVDGACDLEAYANAAQRILIVMREPNDSRGEVLLDLMRSGPKYQVWRNIARWSAGLLHGFPEFSEVQDEAMQRVTLRSVAVINLKKRSGGSSADLALVHAYAARDQDLLRRQVTLLAPNVILACGTLEPLIWLLGLDAREGRSRILGSTMNGDPFIVLPWHHPSARGCAKASYDGLAARVKMLQQAPTIG